MGSGGVETCGEGQGRANLRAGGTRSRNGKGVEALAGGARFHMGAVGIFKAGASWLPGLVDRVLGEAGLTRKAVDLVVPHQASGPALEHARRLMGGDPNRVLDIFATHGNQIAASLPTALTEAHARGLLTPGKTVLLLGTAAGISTAAMVIRT